MISKDNKLILNGVLIFSILSLSIAYFIQYVLSHKPCNLCLIERIPYIASVILISLIFIITKFEKIISIIILLFFIFATIVSFYHFGIEQGFFNESLVCDLGNNTNFSNSENVDIDIETNIDDDEIPKNGDDTTGVTTEDDISFVDNETEEDGIEITSVDIEEDKN